MVYQSTMALKWFPVITLLIATPAAAGQSGSQQGEEQHPAPRRPLDRLKPGAAPCPGCATQAPGRPPLLEAPNAALVMIPARYEVEATEPGDWL